MKINQQSHCQRWLMLATEVRRARDFERVTTLI